MRLAFRVLKASEFNTVIYLNGNNTKRYIMFCYPGESGSSIGCHSDPCIALRPPVGET